MKKFLSMFLVVITLFTCSVLSGCATSTTSKETSVAYEEQFLGKWSNEDALFSFQYKDNVYCGGAVSSELSTVAFEKYAATKTTLTIYMEDGRVEEFNYKFEDGSLYLDDTKLEKFN